MYHELDDDGVKIANEDTDLDELPVEETSVIPFFNYTHLGEDPGRLFGLKLKDNGLGYFTENRNKDSCEIQFKGKIPTDTKIYLQYLTNGMNACGETMVHPYFYEYIVSGVHVERIRHGGRTEAWRLADAKEEFDRQYLLTLDYTWEWSVEDIVELMKSGYGLYPKH
jgi:hypothetical protein